MTATAENPTVTLDQVIAAAGEIWYPEGVELWIDAPNRALHNATPRQYVEAGDGDKVLNLIAALADGAVL